MDYHLVIGDTGTGKSTLISIVCPNSIKKESIVSGGTKSKTKKSEVYGLRFVDSMGTNDSNSIEMKYNDKDILTDIIKQIYDPKGLKLKIVWMVNKANRMQANLQKQAQFISTIGSFGGNSANPWNSTLIVVKEGTLIVKKKDIQGTLAAAAKFGAPTSSNKDSEGTLLGDVASIGYKYFDAMEEDEPMKEDILNGEMKDSRRKKYGILKKDEIKETIIEELNKLKFIELKLEKKKCKQCSVIGDSRFVANKCHSNHRMIHETKNEFKHSGRILKKHLIESTTKFHKGNLVKKHWSEGITKYHSGKPMKSHKESCELIEKGIGGWYHPNVEVIYVYPCGVKVKYDPSENFEKLMAEKTPVGARVFWMLEKVSIKYLCDNCERESHTTGCYRDTIKEWNCGLNESNAGCIDICSECDEEWNSDGCSEKHKCCGRIKENKYRNAPGCIDICSECDEEWNSVGCSEKHNCCNKIKESNSNASGCVDYYSCCKGDESEGCKYKCCGKEKSSEGCVKICANCDGKWGKSEGCIVGKSHKFD